MPTYRGISITLQSQYDALTIPEFPPPLIQLTPSPGRSGAQHSSANPHKLSHVSSDEPASTGTAEVYVPIYAGSQFWISYTCPTPCPVVKYYFFKLFYQDQCLVSWGAGADVKWSGKVMYGIFDGGTDFEGRQVLEKRAFSFAKPDKGVDQEADFEIRVFRSKNRKREPLKSEKYEGLEAGESGIE